MLYSQVYAYTFVFFCYCILLLLLLINLKIVLCVLVFCLYVYVPLACLGPMEIRTSDALEVELWMIVSSIVDAETELRFSTRAVNAEPPLLHLLSGFNCSVGSSHTL